MSTYDVVVSPLGAAFEAVGPSPRHPNWLIAGYGPTPMDAISDFKNRYRQEGYLPAYSPSESEVVRVDLDPPLWLPPVEPGVDDFDSPIEGWREEFPEFAKWVDGLPPVEWSQEPEDAITDDETEVPQSEDVE